MFTEAQLNSIKRAAIKTKNQGEMAVPRYLLEAGIDNFFSIEQWEIVKFCAEECKRQHSGEMSVYDMVNAWNVAQVLIIPRQELNLDIISSLGQIIEPVDNAKGFRTIPIGVTGDTKKGEPAWIEKAQYAEIPRLLEHLLASYYMGGFLNRYIVVNANHPLAETDEDQFYFEFENIHPFVDGNGRTGKILYNYLKGTLDNPQMPPNFWGGSNP